MSPLAEIELPDHEPLEGLSVLVPPVIDRRYLDPSGM